MTSLTPELLSKEAYEVVRQIPYSEAERGYIKYEFSSGAVVSEHQLVLVEAAVPSASIES